jgi:hypothetical protein
MVNDFGIKFSTAPSVLQKLNSVHGNKLENNKISSLQREEKKLNALDTFEYKTLT